MNFWEINLFSSQDEKMKSLKQELVESKAKLENLTSTKPIIDDSYVTISLKPKDNLLTSFQEE